MKVSSSKTQSGYFSIAKFVGLKQIVYEVTKLFHWKNYFTEKKSIVFFHPRICHLGFTVSVRAKLRC